MIGAVRALLSLELSCSPGREWRTFQKREREVLLQILKRQRELEALEQANAELEESLRHPPVRPRLADPPGVFAAEQDRVRETWGQLEIARRGGCSGAASVQNKDRTLAASAVVRAARVPNKDRTLAAESLQTRFARGRQIGQPPSSPYLEVPRVSAQEKVGPPRVIDPEIREVHAGHCCAVNSE